MLKIFSTQVGGVLKRIQEQEEHSIEESGRLLAQAVVGQGTIYIKGFDELSGLFTQWCYGEEKMDRVKEFISADVLTSADRVILLAPHSSHEEAITLARKLRDEDISVVGVSALQKEKPGVEELVDLHIDTKSGKGFIPTEDGNRIGKPSVLASSFILHALQFVIIEIMEDYE